MFDSDSFEPFSCFIASKYDGGSEFSSGADGVGNVKVSFDSIVSIEIDDRRFETA